MSFKKMAYILSLIFFLMAFLSIFSAVDFSRLHSKGDSHLVLLGKIYGKYPVRQEKVTHLRLLEEKWIHHIKDYERSTRNDRSQSLKTLKKTYSDILVVMKGAADDMKIYSDELVLDFTDRIHDVDTESMDKMEYSYYYESRNHFQVIKREFYRAHTAYLRKQYAYSVALYDRGILMMMNTYKKLNWSLPKILQKAG